MKQLSLPLLGLSLIFASTLNSCIIYTAAPAPADAAAAGIDHRGGFLGMSFDEFRSLSPDEREAVLYLFTINSFNDICDELTIGRLPESLAIAEIKELNTILREIDPAFYQQGSSPIWALITSPPYSDYHRAIKDKIAINLITFGVYLEPEMIPFNPRLQAQMFDFSTLVFRPE